MVIGVLNRVLSKLPAKENMPKYNLLVEIERGYKCGINRHSLKSGFQNGFINQNQDLIPLTHILLFAFRAFNNTCSFDLGF